MANICPYTVKCDKCKHYRKDPERNNQYACFLNNDQEKDHKQTIREMIAKREHDKEQLHNER